MECKQDIKELDLLYLQNERFKLLYAQNLLYENSYSECIDKLILDLKENDHILLPILLLISNYIEISVKNFLWAHKGLGEISYKDLGYDNHKIKKLIEDEEWQYLIYDDFIDKKDYLNYKKTIEYFASLSENGTDLSIASRYALKIHTNEPYLNTINIKYEEFHKKWLLLRKTQKKIIEHYRENLISIIDFRDIDYEIPLY